MRTCYSSSSSVGVCCSFEISLTTWKKIERYEPSTTFSDARIVNLGFFSSVQTKIWITKRKIYQFQLQPSKIPLLGRILIPALYDHSVFSQCSHSAASEGEVSLTTMSGLQSTLYRVIQDIIYCISTGWGKKKKHPYSHRKFNCQWRSSSNTRQAFSTFKWKKVIIYQ